MRVTFEVTKRMCCCFKWVTVATLVAVVAIVIGIYSAPVPSLQGVGVPDLKPTNALRPSSPAYRRLSQSYMTTPEWLEVDLTIAYGHYLRHTPFYEFPYFSAVRLLWSQIGAATNKAIELDGWWPTLGSSYFWMNMVTGTLTMCVFGLLGILSAPIYLSIAGQEADAVLVRMKVPASETASLRVDLGNLRDGNHTQLYSDHTVEAWLPRYTAFLSTLQTLASLHPDLELISVAGQTSIVAKIRWSPSSTSHVLPLIQRQAEDCKQESGALLTWLEIEGSDGDIYKLVDYCYTIVPFPVASLMKVIRKFDEPSPTLSPMNVKLVHLFEY